ncbi:protein phosphatase 1, regulatory subunit 3Da [Lepisosteus oculatus]|uniref:protein phosphatase 1, regulatory subunit 3Da n=1 Tax=Lepisosteus oculatus TaxID=7918 RepID=UPI0035F50696
MEMARPVYCWQQPLRGGSPTELALPRNLSNISRRYFSVQLADGFGEEAAGKRKPVSIRPPAPREPPCSKTPNDSPPHCEPKPKPIIRRRARSLPSSPHRRRGSLKDSGSQRVRFVDSLGLDLAEVKVFRAGDDPSVPLHVLSRLLLSSELASGRQLEIPLHYLQADYPAQPGDRVDFHQRLRHQRVCLERALCSELGITGSVWVLNLAFEKEVGLRYSFTGWKSSADTKACWESSVREDRADGGPGSDQFRFHLPVPPFILHPGATLEFAICYRVAGAEFWDNNDGRNYSFTCHSYKLTVPKECEDSLVHFI